MEDDARKKALRQLTYGLYIATSRDSSGYAAGTINWLSQSSFDPPLVMAAIQADSSLHQAISRSSVFAVHILGKSQRHLATSFFKTAKQDGDRLNGFRFATGSTGCPILDDPPAWIECRVVEAVQRGDHTIFVAEVVDAGWRREEQPLTLRETGFSYGG